MSRRQRVSPWKWSSQEGRVMMGDETGREWKHTESKGWDIHRERWAIFKSSFHPVCSRLRDFIQTWLELCGPCIKSPHHSTFSSSNSAVSCQLSINVSPRPTDHEVQKVDISNRRMKQQPEPGRGLDDAVRSSWRARLHSHCGLIIIRCVGSFSSEEDDQVWWSANTRTAN